MDAAYFELEPDRVWAAGFEPKGRQFAAVSWVPSGVTERPGLDERERLDRRTHFAR